MNKFSPKVNPIPQISKLSIVFWGLNPNDAVAQFGSNVRYPIKSRGQAQGISVGLPTQKQL
jgi:hypothetical protein